MMKGKRNIKRFRRHHRRRGRPAAGQIDIEVFYQGRAARGIAKGTAADDKTSRGTRKIETSTKEGNDEAEEEQGRWKCRERGWQQSRWQHGESCIVTNLKEDEREAKDARNKRCRLQLVEWWQQRLGQEDKKALSGRDIITITTVHTSNAVSIRLLHIPLICQSTPSVVMTIRNWSHPSWLTVLND